jgi:hypothetical protein
MRFSTLAVSLLSGLSVFKGISASPIDSAALAKRQTIDEVVNDLKSAVVSLIFTPCPIVFGLTDSCHLSDRPLTNRPIRY